MGQMTDRTSDVFKIFVDTDCTWQSDQILFGTDRDNIWSLLNKKRIKMIIQENILKKSGDIGRCRHFSGSFSKNGSNWIPAGKEDRNFVILFFEHAATFKTIPNNNGALPNAVIDDQSL